MKLNLNQDFEDYIYTRSYNKIFNEKEKGVKRIKHWNEKRYFRKTGSYKIFIRILNKFINHHHNDAFSYYCSIETNREKRELFLGHLTFITNHTVYKYYRTAGFRYQVVDGIILRTLVKQKPRVIYSHDYKTETVYVDKCGIERGQKIRWLNWNGIDKWTETKKVISGQVYHFDSKNNYLYKRTWKEREQAKLKAARSEIKPKIHPNDIKYVIKEKVNENGLRYFSSLKEANQFLVDRGVNPSYFIIEKIINNANIQRT